MTDRRSRLEHAQREVAAATARVDELAAQVPEPVGSVAEALRSLTPEQREAIWAQRTEAMRLVALELEEQRVAFDALTEKARALSAEFERLTTDAEYVESFAGRRSTVELAPQGRMPASFERMNEIAEWFSQHDEEIGQLKTLIRELEALYAELQVAAY